MPRIWQDLILFKNKNEDGNPLKQWKYDNERKKEVEKRKRGNDKKEEIKEDEACDKIIRYRVKKKAARSEISKSKI